MIHLKVIITNILLNLLKYNMLLEIKYFEKILG